MYIYLCEDSLEGIFTGVYDAWASRLGHGNIKLALQRAGTMELFAEYIEVSADSNKAQKVSRTICSRMGMAAYSWICQALMADDGDKADAVYRTIVSGLALKDGSQIVNHLTDPAVCKVFELSRAVGNETHSYLGFIRFKELFNGVLLAQFGPKHNIISALAPHFADRLPGENWMIYDDKRELFVVHQAHHQWVMMVSQEINKESISKISTDEKEFQRLWRGFRESISIKERESYDLQRQMMPLRYRGHMVEYDR